MPHALLTPQVITHETLQEFQNNLNFLMNVTHQYEDRFAISGAKIGDTLNLRKPNGAEATEGASISTYNDFNEDKASLVIEKQFKVAMHFEGKDMALTVDDFRKRYIAPSARALANKVEAYALDKAYKGVANTVGTPGTVPNGTTALETYLSAGERLDTGATPLDDRRCLLITPKMQTKIVDSLKGLFQSSEQIKKQYLTGRMGTAAGFDWMMNQVLRTHIVGPLGGTPAVYGASQTGASLITNGWTAAAANRLKKGDVFTIAGLYKLNPLTFDQTQDLQQFVVTADANSNSSGEATISIEPSIVVTGPKRNVSGSPDNGALLTILGAANTVTPQGLAWHPDAFAFAAPPMPDVSGLGARCTRSVDKQTGISIRIVEQYDAKEDMHICRLDVLCGFVIRNSNFACRVAS